MRKTIRDGDLKITFEGPVSSFERLGRKKSRKTAKKNATRRVRVVHK